MFADRRDAGWQLAQKLRRLRGPHVVVLGPPSGGVPVAAEVANALGTPLDVLVVRKLGVPGHTEIAMGAVGEGGVRVVNQQVLHLAGVSQTALAAVERTEREAVRHRAARLRQGRVPASLAGRTVVIVDDGIATGATAQAACQIAGARSAAKVILAVPVAPPDGVERLSRVADEVVCVNTPTWFGAVGEAYREFPQVSDREVIDLLERAAVQHPAPSTPPMTAHVTIHSDGTAIAGDLFVPARAKGVVIFAHGSGSSRHSLRNVYVARVLHDAGFATLLLDLLTPAEDLNRAEAFNIELLATRLADATTWVRGQPWGEPLPISWFGAGTGAAAALWAAAEPDADVAAVVSRGGRPDLAGERLGDVRAATLLIVDGDDRVVLDLNNGARARMRCPNRLSIVPGATHLLEEPGTLDAMAEQACDWFRRHLHPAAGARHSGASLRDLLRGAV
jgi:putative phosphoribosyl transferase